MMLNLRLARPVLIALTACAANIFVQGSALADDAQENKVLKEQMKQIRISTISYAGRCMIPRRGAWAASPATRASSPTRMT